MNFLSLYKRRLLYKFKKKINLDLNKEIKINSLDELFSFYNTDKANKWNFDKREGHGFASFYEKHFKNFKKNKLNILEIGSFSGASAAAFSKYFPSSNIYCLDVNISNFKYLSDQIKVFG